MRSPAATRSPVRSTPLAPLSRRRLLRGAAGLGLALPWLAAMEGKTRAARRPPPRRFVVFFTANGTIREKWLPFGGETDFRFTNPDRPDELRILAPLESWKKQLVVLDGLAAKTRNFGPGANGHDKGMGHMLTCAELRVGPSGVADFAHLPDGSVGGPSIDQEIAARLPADTAFSSLEFGVRARLDTKRQLTSRMCYRGPFQVVPPESDPSEMWKTLVGGGAASGRALGRLRAERKSVLDAVLDDFRALDATLGAADRKKLDAHATAVREIERGLTRPPARRPRAFRQVAAPAPLDPWDNDGYEALGRAQMDLLAMAIACDQTRVASLQWSTAQSEVRFTWLGIKEGHHEISHLINKTQEARDQMTVIENWHAKQFAYLLERLAAVAEGDGTVLDHSIVMWVNEQGDGAKHSEKDIPYVLAGGGARRLRTGRYLRYPDRAHNDLYVSLLHAMGVTDVASFGMEQVCQGPLPGLV